MSVQADDPQAAASPGCGTAVFAMAAATVPVAAGLTIATGLVGLFIPILIVTLAIVAVFGSLSFLLLRRHPSAPKVTAAGFATGWVVPALGLLANFGNGVDVADLLGVIGFGIAGAVGALITWFLIVWQTRYEGAEIFIVGSALLGSVLFTLIL